MPKRIMIVDDEPLIIQTLTPLLVAHGYMVLAASSGADLLAKLPAFRPDAILLDVMMPKMNGFQVAEQLGHFPATATIPIIFLSAVISPFEPQDSPAKPTHHFLGKPFETETLLKLLKRICV